jgi:hypothetical protein
LNKYLYNYVFKLNFKLFNNFQVIHTHFWLKRHEIVAQIEGWIRDMEMHAADRRSARTISLSALALRVRCIYYKILFYTSMNITHSLNLFIFINLSILLFFHWKYYL